jgi:hypothetical protein
MLKGIWESVDANAEWGITELTMVVCDANMINVAQFTAKEVI